MNKPLGEHIEQLEKRLQRLSELSKDDSTSRHGGRHRIDAEIRVTNIALDHYRSALELESHMQDMQDFTP